MPFGYSPLSFERHINRTQIGRMYASRSTKKKNTYSIESDKYLCEAMQQNRKHTKTIENETKNKGENDITKIKPNTFCLQRLFIVFALI